MEQQSCFLSNLEMKQSLFAFQLGKAMQVEAKSQVTQPMFYLQLAVFLSLTLAFETALGGY